MTRDELLSELKDLAPFLHSLDLPHGLNTNDPELGGKSKERSRLQDLKDHIWPRMLEKFGGSLNNLRVLDIACNCGGFSFEAASAGASEVLGIEIVDHYIRQANFIKDAIGATNVRFELGSLDDLSPETHGKFDVVFCFGILYHLENPVGSMRKIASVAKNVMFVDTALIPSPRPMWLMTFPSALKEARKTTSLWRSEEGVCQFTPSREAVERLLQFLGFSSEFMAPVGKILQEERYRDGKRGTFMAVRA